jgi:hypothetical protein
MSANYEPSHDNNIVIIIIIIIMNSASNNLFFASSSLKISQGTIAATALLPSLPEASHLHVVAMLSAPVLEFILLLKLSIRKAGRAAEEGVGIP